MTFAGINYLAVLIAAVAGWIVGAIWYMALAKPWMTALGTDARSRSKRRSRSPAPGCRSCLRSPPAWSWPGCSPASWDISGK